MPRGIFSVTLSIVLVSTSLALIATPLILTLVPDAQVMLWNGQQVDTFQETLIASLAGLSLGEVCIALINGLARGLASFSVWALGKGE